MISPQSMIDNNIQSESLEYKINQEFKFFDQPYFSTVRPDPFRDSRDASLMFYISGVGTEEGIMTYNNGCESQIKYEEIIQWIWKAA